MEDRTRENLSGLNPVMTVKAVVGVRVPHPPQTIGEVAERFMALVLKTRVRESAPGVRIPPSPQGAKPTSQVGPGDSYQVSIEECCPGFASLAQMVERILGMDEVIGSVPIRGSTVV